MTNNDIGSPPVGAADAADSGDADLVLRTRSGDAAAFGELWRRHYRSGVTVARSVSSSLDPDDLVQEAYTRIYASIVTGGGPTGSFRAYLFTSIRNTAAGWGRARRESAIDALDTIEDPATSDQATAAALDHGLTHRAFRSLPTRWQEVLWYSEIEGMKPSEIAPLLGMKASAVAQLTFRAREGLREAWIQAHLRSVADGSDCQWTIEHLGSYSRANISRRDRVKVESHLAGCARCAIVASEAKEVSGRLALVLLPLTVGAVGTAGYLASLQGGGAALVTLAAMPSAVMQGAVTVLPVIPGAASVAMGATGTAGSAGGVAAGVGSAGAGAGTAAAGFGSVGASAAGSAAAGAGSTAVAAGSAAAAAGSAGAAVAAGSVGVAAVAATAAAGGGILSGLGAMASLATASLIVAGTVVAAAIALPSFAPTSRLVEDHGISIVQEAAAPVFEPQADGSAAEAPLVEAGDELPPVTVADTTETTDDGDTTPDAGTSAEGTQPNGPGEHATPTQPEHPAKSEHPATPSPSAAGQQKPDPQPSSAPGQQKPDPQPSSIARKGLPDGSPAFAASTSYILDGTDEVNIAVAVTGEPGATAQLRVRGVARATGVIGDDGTATLLLQPTAQEVRTDARVDLRYVSGDFAGPPVGAFISDLL